MIGDLSLGLLSAMFVLIFYDTIFNLHANLQYIVYSGFLVCGLMWYTVVQQQMFKGILEALWEN